MKIILERKLEEKDREVDRDAGRKKTYESGHDTAWVSAPSRPREQGSWRVVTANIRFEDCT